MSFWAAIAALILLLLRQEVKEWHRLYSVAAVTLAALSFVAWLFWTAGLSKAHKHDRDVSRFFEHKMMELAQLKFAPGIQTQADQFQSRRHFGSIWSHQLQLAITALLLAAFAFVAWTKQPNQGPEPMGSAVNTRGTQAVPGIHP